MNNLRERMLPGVRIEPATVRIPDGRTSDRATAPGELKLTCPVWKNRKAHLASKGQLPFRLDFLRETVLQKACNVSGQCKGCCINCTVSSCTDGSVGCCKRRGMINDSMYWVFFFFFFFFFVVVVVVLCVFLRFPTILEAVYGPFWYFLSFRLVISPLWVRA